MRPQRDPGAAVRHPPALRSPASTASSASMPSAGAMGSRALKVSERATPMSDHWPQLIVVAGRSRCPSPRRPRRRATRSRRRRRPARANPAGTTSKRTRPTSRVLGRPWRACSRKAPAALGAQTRSRLSLLRAATIWSSITAAPCTTPRRASPVSSAAVTSRSATPGAAISPGTTAICARSSSSARTVRCSSEGSDRPLSTTRPAPLSTSQRATTRPIPPRPPVTMYEPSGRTTGSCLRRTERRAREPFDIPAARRARRSHRRYRPTPARLINGATASSAVSRSTRVVRRSGCS